jgi:cytidylate kinase
MIFAIYGPSCVGKSTVSSRVAAELNLQFRSCGSAVRDRASVLGIDIKELPDAIHREIDQETVAWALTHQPCVVEGRFLDLVLAAVDNRYHVHSTTRIKCPTSNQGLQFRQIGHHD